MEWFSQGIKGIIWNVAMYLCTCIGDARGSHLCIYAVWVAARMLVAGNPVRETQLLIWSSQLLAPTAARAFACLSGHQRILCSLPQSGRSCSAVATSASLELHLT